MQAITNILTIAAIVLVTAPFAIMLYMNELGHGLHLDMYWPYFKAQFVIYDVIVRHVIEAVQMEVETWSL